ncbi:hypothetical protein GGS20DRAFT_392648 [Poronia punctata]|nr:hypothetical protein GGS20DRAFT_392648 [Poronia punctata]
MATTDNESNSPSPSPSPRRSTILLISLLTLFLSSISGTTLSIVDMATNKSPPSPSSSCLSRDLILFSAILSLSYIYLHIRGARKKTKKENENGALIVSRLAICAWIAALISTAILGSRHRHGKQGTRGGMLVLNLLVCAGAIPSSIIISIIIEKRSSSSPFSTKSHSSSDFHSDSSFLNCRVSEFEQDLSVSRRASLIKFKSKKQSEKVELQAESIIPLTTSSSTGQIGPNNNNNHVVGFGFGVEEEKEVVVPPPPPPTYCPGAWRVEWDGGDDNLIMMLDDDAVPVPPEKVLPHRLRRATAVKPRPNMRPTVRYSSQPELAVRLPVKVVWNTARRGSAPTTTTTVTEAGVGREAGLGIDPFLLLLQEKEPQRHHVHVDRGCGVGG